MKILIDVVVIYQLIQMGFAQLTTIPIGRKCGCIDMAVNNPQISLVATNGYQNLQQIPNTPVTNALLNAIQLSRLPIANNVQLTPTSLPICQERTAVSVTPNLQAINLGNFGNLANIANIGTLANMANVGTLPNIANVGSLANIANVGSLANIANVGSLANIANVGSISNIGLQFLPNTGNVNVPVRLRRNIQKNFGGLCNSAITYDSTLLGLY